MACATRAVGPDADGKLSQPCQGRQGRDNADGPVRHPLLSQIQRQVRQREADARQTKEVGPVHARCDCANP